VIVIPGPTVPLIVGNAVPDDATSAGDAAAATPLNATANKTVHTAKNTDRRSITRTPPIEKHDPNENVQPAQLVHPHREPAQVM
jgi:hypothetical protein